MRRVALWSVLIGLVLPFGNACSKFESNLSSLSSSSLSASDVFFSLQWHLRNTGQRSGIAGEDIRVLPAWESGAIGSGVVVAIVDDGAEIVHPDLRNRFRAGASYNYNNGGNNPGGPAALHGTAVSGLIAGDQNNGIGITGVAPGAEMVAWNFLESSNTDATEVDAMTRLASLVGVSNNSWGPGPGGRGLFRGSSTAWQNAVQTGLTTGRDGKGTVYVFAAGNGALSTNGLAADHSNLNGYTNFYGVIAVCAVDERGVAATYSEPGANLWVCAPSGNGSITRPGITTTDLVGGLFGYNLSASLGEIGDRSYTQRFNGTSAAAPLVSGVAALILGVRPELSWRDVRWILARSARKNDANDAGWATNAATPALNIHYDYGFGVVNAAAAVELARTWTPVGPMKIHSQMQATGGLNINDSGTAATSAMTVNASGINKIEYVEVTVDVAHNDWGNLVIDLKRNGVSTTTSRLTVNHRCLDANNAEVDCTVSGGRWRFGTTRHLGESADGVWTLEVFDGDGREGRMDGKTGTFTNWQMRIFGE